MMNRIEPNGRVLLVIPGDLHAKTIDAAREQWHIAVTPIDCQESYQNLLNSDRRLPNGFYITSYTQLASNGTMPMPDPDQWAPAALLDWLCLKPAAVETWWADRGVRFRNEYQLLGLDPVTATLEAAEAALQSQDTRLAQWYDQKAADAQRRKLAKAWAVLRMVCPTDSKRPQMGNTLPQSLVGLNPRGQSQEGFPIDSKRPQMGNTLPQSPVGLNPRGQSQEGFPADSKRPQMGNTLPQSPVGLNPRGGISTLSDEQLTWVQRETCRSWIAHCSEGLGEVRAAGDPTAPTERTDHLEVHCVFNPTLADLAWDAFDCVVVDEGVKMKGADTLIGKGVRKMAPTHRMVLTATPVKNRVPDLFWLAWWAAGGKADAHARWPFAGEAKEQTTFAETFLVAERNISKEKAAAAEGKRNRYQKLTAEVCNIHRLWKLLAPIVLRRRKADTGEVIVPKIRHVVRVPMGTEQMNTYAYHVHSDYRDLNGQKAIGAQLQALRGVAGDPTSELLKDQPGLSSRETQFIPRSSQDYTPKIAACLKLIDQVLRNHEQVVVFSAFHDPLDTLSRYLNRAGVRHVKLDGRVSQKQRGAAAVEFRKGLASGIPVQLAGVESMSEGHDFYLANNAILLSFSWAWDKFEQAINRVHRMTSPKPVNVWSIVAEGTIDRRLESLLHEKGDSAELVLDGKLLGERAEEVNLAELLATAVSEFNPESKSVPERELRNEWPELEARLRAAMEQWGKVEAPRAERTTLITAAAAPRRIGLPRWRREG